MKLRSELVALQFETLEIWCEILCRQVFVILIYQVYENLQHHDLMISGKQHILIKNIRNIRFYDTITKRS